jgi:hypothetical protein
MPLGFTMIWRVPAVAGGRPRGNPLVAVEIFPHYPLSAKRGPTLVFLSKKINLSIFALLLIFLVRFMRIFSECGVNKILSEHFRNSLTPDFICFYSRRYRIAEKRRKMGK